MRQSAKYPGLIIWKELTKHLVDTFGVLRYGRHGNMLFKLGRTGGIMLQFVSVDDGGMKGEASSAHGEYILRVVRRACIPGMNGRVG